MTSQSIPDFNLLIDHLSKFASLSSKTKQSLFQEIIYFIQQNEQEQLDQIKMQLLANPFITKYFNKNYRTHHPAHHFTLPEVQFLISVSFNFNSSYLYLLEAYTFLLKEKKFPIDTETFRYIHNFAIFQSFFDAGLLEINSCINSHSLYYYICNPEIIAFLYQNGLDPNEHINDIFENIFKYNQTVIFYFLDKIDISKITQNHFRKILSLQWFDDHYVTYSPLKQEKIKITINFIREVLTIHQFYSMLDAIRLVRIIKNEYISSENFVFFQNYLIYHIDLTELIQCIEEASKYRNDNLVVSLIYLTHLISFESLPFPLHEKFRVDMYTYEMVKAFIKCDYPHLAELRECLKNNVLKNLRKLKMSQDEGKNMDKPTYVRLGSYVDDNNENKPISIDYDHLISIIETDNVTEINHHQDIYYPINGLNVYCCVYEKLREF